MRTTDVKEGKFKSSKVAYGFMFHLSKEDRNTNV